MKDNPDQSPPARQRQFVFKIEGEATVLPRLFFAMQLEHELNAQLNLADYSPAGSLQEIRIRFMAYKKLSISHRGDNYRYRPEARYLDIGLEVDFDVLEKQENESAKAMITDFLLYALEEYMEVPNFDHPRFLHDVRAVLIE